MSSNKLDKQFISLHPWLNHPLHPIRTVIKTNLIHIQLPQDSKYDSARCCRIYQDQLGSVFIQEELKEKCGKYSHWYKMCIYVIKHSTKLPISFKENFNKRTRLAVMIVIFAYNILIFLIFSKIANSTCIFHGTSSFFVISVWPKMLLMSHKFSKIMKSF